jgi:uncharacterized SAM-binding protein YcdF (DUF218 family)
VGSVNFAVSNFFQKPTWNDDVEMVMRKNVRRVFLGLSIFLVLGLIGALGAFLFPQQVLLVDNGRSQADAIVLLGGGSGERPTRAAELFKAGVAPRIIVSGAGDAGGNRLLLMNRGVPSSAIELEPDSRTTKENAQFSIPLLRAAGSKQVVIVTSWYHSRRALNCFRHYASDIQFYSAPSYYGFSRTDWSRGNIRRRIRAEYIKTLGYWVCYGVCPF